MNQLPNPTRAELTVERMEQDIAYFLEAGNQHAAEQARRRLGRYLAKLDNQE